MLSRRRALTLGAGALVTGGLGAACTSAPGAEPPASATGERIPSGPGVPAVAVGVQRLHSAARGQEVALAAMIPTGTPAGELPVCLVLHGRGGSAVDMVRLGLPGLLADALRAPGRPPFALVAVDGGADYWLARSTQDDPQAMLRDELPSWLPPLGLSATPRAVVGISMGGFGALVYARGRAANPPAVGVLSPALFRTWADARAKNAFADEPTWAAAEPLRHPGGLSRLGVWCGQSDPFIAVARQLAAVEHPAVARFGEGGHTEEYWRGVFPEVLGFVAPSRA